MQLAAACRHFEAVLCNDGFEDSQCVPESIIVRVLSTTHEGIGGIVCLCARSMAKSTCLVLFLVLGIVSSLGIGGVVKGVMGQLRADYYNVTCPSVEKIVRSRMSFHFQQSPLIAGHLLRLQFHDCAATGCDASLLLTGSQSEQAASPNLSLRGFDILDDIKAQVEANCTGIVSCSDIIAMAARDAVALTGGPNFTVPLGRYDSLVSGGENVSLPSPDFTVPQADTFFQNLGLNATDLAVLLGAHTIGVAHCSSFVDRLYNFQNTTKPDPSMNITLLTALQQTCPQTNPTDNITVALDDITEFVFDNKWYSDVAQHRGVLTLDEEVLTSNLTASTVNQMGLNQILFFQRFTASLIKMGLVGVKDATNGDIRTNCSVVGTPSPASSPAFAPAPSPASGADSPVGAPVTAASSSGSPHISPPPTSGA